MRTKLFIGDPCYCLPDSIYYGVWQDQLGFADGDIIDEKADIKYGTVHGTAVGDGDYSNVCNTRTYGVDSGTLGICDLSKFESKETDEKLSKLGRVVEVEDLVDFDVYYDDCDGKFTFVWTDKNGSYSEEVVTGFNEEDYWEEEAEAEANLD